MSSLKLKKEENIQTFIAHEMRQEFSEAIVPFLVYLASALIMLGIAKDYVRVGFIWQWVLIRLAYLPVIWIVSRLTRSSKFIRMYLPELPVWASGSYLVWFCSMFAVHNGTFSSDYVSGIFQFYLGVALMPITAFTFFGFTFLSSLYYYFFISWYAGPASADIYSQSLSNYISYLLFASLIFYIVTRIRREKIRLKYQLVQNIDRQQDVISRQAREIAQTETDRSLFRISQSISHDMRAPIGIFERLLLTKDEDLPKMKSAVRESVNRLYTMVESLRYGEVENIIDKSSATLDLAFGTETLQLKAEKNQICLSVPQEPFPMCYLDHPKMQRAWINLASNAVEFAKTFARVEIKTEGRELFIRVIDDGPGIAEDFLPRLFQRGATHGKHDGTGLGLAYVRQVIRGHGGEVVYKRENGLTIFECHVPEALTQDECNLVKNSDSVVRKQPAKPIINVAICVEPIKLNQTILENLMALGSEKFSFTENRTEAHVVISNIDTIMLEALDRSDQEYISVKNFSHDENILLQLLKLKLNFI